VKKEEIASRFRSVLVDQLGVPASQCVESADLVGDLGMDSLDGVEVVMAVEQEFRIDIPDEDADRIFTVGAAIRYLEGVLLTEE